MPVPQDAARRLHVRRRHGCLQRRVVLRLRLVALHDDPERARADFEHRDRSGAASPSRVRARSAPLAPFVAATASSSAAIEPPPSATPSRATSVTSRAPSVASSFVSSLAPDALESLEEASAAGVGAESLARRVEGEDSAFDPSTRRRLPGARLR